MSRSKKKPPFESVEVWLKKRPQTRGRLANILKRLCWGSWNATGEDKSPSEITKEEFFSLTGAGKKSWEEFEKLKSL